MGTVKTAILEKLRWIARKLGGPFSHGLPCNPDLAIVDFKSERSPNATASTSTHAVVVSLLS